MLIMLCFLLDLFMFENWTNRLLHNIGKELPLYAA